MESLHEAGGILSQIISFLSFDNLKIERDKRRKEIDAYNAEKPYLGGDISKYSKDLIMTFPVMFDNSLPAKTASLINKANERNVIAMLQMLFASVQTKGQTGKDIIAKFHKNIATNADVYDVLDTLDTINSKLGESLTAKEKDMVKYVTEYCKTYMNNLKSFPVESLNETSLNDYLVYESSYGIAVHEAKRPPKKTRKDKEAESAKKGFDKNDDENSNINVGFTGTQLDTVEKEKELANINKIKAQAAKDNADAALTKAKTDVEYTKGQTEYLSKMLLPNEVKKANELAPALMLIRYYDAEGVGNTFVAGVKSRLISVDAVDMVERIAAKNKTAFNFKNIIRATTGEISFMKDLVLSLDQAKIDAKNAVKKGPAAKMWNVLEYRGAKNSAHKLKKSDNDASAITLLVLNQETVNILKNNYKINMDDVRTAKQIMDVYNLLGIAICDESVEVAKFLYSGNDQYEQYAYSFLGDANNKNADDSYKKIIDAMAYRR